MVLQVLTIAAVRWDLCFRRHSITRERFPIVARTCVLVNSLSRVIDLCSRNMAQFQRGGTDSLVPQGPDAPRRLQLGLRGKGRV